MKKLVQHTFYAFDFDGHARRRIQNVAEKSETAGEFINEWTKADALHNAAHPYLFP